ncbi:MAG TPA: response regulator transcription factor [Chitinophagaceae bacterium]|jgi:DNA-binding NarL/FixJ family response regulator|nr:response regulator transcription factor [Chitinophagaceae bacterium]
MITIIIYDDNNDLRGSIRQLLSEVDRFAVTGDHANCNHVMQQVKEMKPDVILMDIDMPLISGIEAVRLIRKFNRTTHIIMLTVFDDNKHVLDAICAGASGYLLKKSIPEKLVNAIDEVLAGGAPMSPSIAKMVVASLQQGKEAERYDLSAREKEVLYLLAKGNSFKMMAAALFISIDTIRSHIKKIYEKLQVHSQTEAISKAYNEKLI